MGDAFELRTNDDSLVNEVAEQVSRNSERVNATVPIANTIRMHGVASTKELRQHARVASSPLHFFSKIIYLIGARESRTDKIRR